MPNARAGSRPLLLAMAVVAAVVAGCGSSASPDPSGTPGPTGEVFTAGELRLLLTEQLGPLWYCDRDSYPVGRDEAAAALASWPEVMAEGEVFRAAATRLGLDPDGPFDDAAKLAVYRLWKVGLAIPFEAVPSGDGYRFDYLAQPVGLATDGVRTIGIIDAAGRITVESRTAAGEPICPICLVRGMRIDTPSGPRPVEELRIGDPVWTLDARGRRAVGTVVALGSADAPASHRVVQLKLADGRSMTASPGHPLADGRRLGDIRVGEIVDGRAVVSVTSVPYGGGRTYDLLASGETGAYFVAGIPTASTIRPAAVAPARS